MTAAPPSTRSTPRSWPAAAVMASTAARVCSAIEQAFAGEYDVKVVHDGLAGFIEATGNAPPDVIIADVEMPKLDGVTMVRRIRLKRSASIPIIFLTGRERPRDVIAGINVGARHYLTKPLNIELLREKLQSPLDTP